LCGLLPHKVLPLVLELCLSGLQVRRRELDYGDLGLPSPEDSSHGCGELGLAA
jgi:hypothetical protein